MKNSIFTKFTWVLALCAFLFTSALYVACTKDVNVANEQPQASNSTAKPSHVNPGLTVREQAESFGKTAYSYVKFYYNTKKPEDYVNPAIRAEVMEKLKNAEAEYKNLSAAESIKKATSDGKITPKMAASLNDLLFVIENSDELKTIEELDTRFKRFEESVYSNKELSDDERVYVNGISITIRSIMRFTEEMKPIEMDRLGNKLQTRESCLLGRKLSCYGSALLKAGVAAASTAIKAGILGTAVLAPAGAAFVVGLFEGLVNVFSNSSCKCAETPGCFVPQTISPIISPTSACNPAVGFIVSGQGTVPPVVRWSAFWTDASGFEHAITDVQNKPTSGPILAPFSVPSPDVKISLRVITLCNGNENITVYEFKLNEMLGEAGSVYISGPYDCYLNGTGTFYMSGGCLINPNNQFSWNNPSVGTIQSGGNTSSATIKFTMKTCGNGYYGGCFPAYIVGNCTNPCSGLQSGDARSCIVH
jgi:hypothetical protein